jgi:hypothetical protein
MTLQPRETVLLVATCLAALLGGSSFLVRNQLASLAALSEREVTLEQELAGFKQNVAQRARFESQLGEVDDKLPRFPADQPMDVHWQRVAATAASSHGVRLHKQEVKGPEQVGGAYELMIDCNEWTGTLDGLIHFLFDLQSEGAMLDVRYLRVKPKGKELRTGQFDLYCAYTLDEEPPEQVTP